jgi:hypothetical protein
MVRLNAQAPRQIEPEGGTDRRPPRAGRTASAGAGRRIGRRPPKRLVHGLTSTDRTNQPTPGAATRKPPEIRRKDPRFGSRTPRNPAGSERSAASRSTRDVTGVTLPDSEWVAQSDASGAPARCRLAFAWRRHQADTENTGGCLPAVTYTSADRSAIEFPAWKRWHGIAGGSVFTNGAGTPRVRVPASFQPSRVVFSPETAWVGESVSSQPSGRLQRRSLPQAVRALAAVGLEEWRTSWTTIVQSHRRSRAVSRGCSGRST